MLRLAGVSRAGFRALVPLLVAAMLAVTACTAAPSPGAAPSQAPGSGQAAPAPADAGAKWPATTAEIAMYKGSERQQMLEAGARKEGTVSWYGATSLDEQQVLAEKIMQKYPFLKVEFARVDGSDIISRVLQETAAGRTSVDLLMSQEILPFIEAGVVTPWWSPLLAEYPKWAVDEQGYFAIRKYLPYGLAYNTNLVPPDREPKRWEDLLDPWWQGKILVEGPFDTKFYVGMVHTMGQDKAWSYIEQLAKLGVLQKGSTARVNAVAAGEHAAALGIFLDLAEKIIAEKGPPMKTVVLDPTVAGPTSMALLKAARHPHAAMLVQDFLFSKEGQEVVADFGRLVTHPGAVYKADQVKLLQKRLATVDVQPLRQEWLADHTATEERLKKLFGVK